MTTIETKFYGEEVTFTAESWEREEVAYMRNSDEAYIFYNSKDAVLERFGSHFDSTILIADDRTMVLFTNTPLSNEMMLELEDASIAFDRFEWSDYGTYEVIDLEAE